MRVDIEDSESHDPFCQQRKDALKTIIYMEDLEIGKNLKPWGVNGCVIGRIIEIDNDQQTVVTVSGEAGFRKFTLDELKKEGAVTGEWVFV